MLGQLFVVERQNEQNHQQSPAFVVGEDPRLRFFAPRREILIVLAGDQKLDHGLVTFQSGEENIEASLVLEHDDVRQTMAELKDDRRMRARLLVLVERLIGLEQLQHELEIVMVRLELHTGARRRRAAHFRRFTKTNLVQRHA